MNNLEAEILRKNNKVKVTGTVSTDGIKRWEIFGKKYTEEELKEIIEKATPKKAIVHGIRKGREVNTISFICPACDKHIGTDKFCKHCGQAIDWREWSIEDE